jgi:phosphoribosyl 1,2-cyclic phosphate phosphodiesterase
MKQSSCTVTILGSGTSHGVPVIACICPVCRSKNPKNHRSRASALVRGAEDEVILFDTAPEFRLQALREGIAHIDAVFYTHAHADHLHGLDDLRPLSFNGPIPLYGSAETMDEIRRRFSYIFSSGQEGGGKPKVLLKPIGPEDHITIGSLEVIPIPLLHGSLPVFGYRIGPFAYLTDCNIIPEYSYELLKGVRFVVIDALRPEPHPTHFSFGQALEAVRKIGAEKAWFTHLTHDVDHEDIRRMLPTGVEPAWDGLSFRVDANEKNCSN